MDTKQAVADAIARAFAPPLKPRKTRLPRGAQWLSHEKPGSRAALRRLRQMARDQKQERP